MLFVKEDGTVKETVDHGEVRAWAERNNGKPQVWDNPAAGSDHIGIRIDFPGRLDEAYPRGPNQPRDISWDEFFVLFDSLGLSFVYEEDRPDVADKSRLYRFDRRLRVE